MYRRGPSGRRPLAFWRDAPLRRWPSEWREAATASWRIAKLSRLPHISPREARKPNQLSNVLTISRTPSDELLLPDAVSALQTRFSLREVLPAGFSMFPSVVVAVVVGGRLSRKCAVRQLLITNPSRLSAPHALQPPLSSLISESLLKSVPLENLNGAGTAWGPRKLHRQIPGPTPPCRVGAREGRHVGARRRPKKLARRDRAGRWRSTRRCQTGASRGRKPLRLPWGGAARIRSGSCRHRQPNMSRDS